MGFINKLIIAIVVLFAAWLIFGIAMISAIDRKNTLDALCRLYMKDGRPDFVIIDGAKYELDRFGKIRDPYEDPFVNPWHRAQLANLGECLIIHGSTDGK